ncbi:3-deoxy-7-phosphoheptulonate synthase [Liberiplasma polymorphum]|uniref:3-deoxy-7-phosphoheptulonate synthase n=1 Tax=Liberiplasma polymorphum TaxID=3374570 RepID=UPI0037734B5E
MIVKMNKTATLNDYQTLVKFLKDKGFEVRDVSSEHVRIFGVIGDTASIEPRDLYAFEGVGEVIRIQTPFKKASRSFKPHNTVIKINDSIEIGGEKTVVMAGPCSVESYEQLKIIAQSVKASGSNILRGGAFKPRTSPYSFQGLGVEGLKILRQVADELDMAVVSEIPSVDLLPEFETYVDIIQVGARNMQNFHLLKALGQSSKPILLKRGLSSTIEEWLMSAEYILNGGNEQVILCERGIRTFETFTRNTLDISSVLAVKELSHLPVIIDPSHAAGRWQMIEKLSLASLAVGADGLIIEVHHKPEEALSDGAQSLKPQKFTHLMDALQQIASALGKEI